MQVMRGNYWYIRNYQSYMSYTPHITLPNGGGAMIQALHCWPMSNVQGPTVWNSLPDDLRAQ